MIKIPKFNSDEDVEINYQVTGEGEPLVLINGLGSKMNKWQVEFFKQKKIKVICFDNRGVGKSSRPNYLYTMEMYVNDTKNLLDHLGINQKIHLCGISMGGMIAQQFVLKYPELVKP